MEACGQKNNDDMKEYSWTKVQLMNFPDGERNRSDGFIRFCSHGSGSKNLPGFNAELFSWL